MDEQLFVDAGDVVSYGLIGDGEGAGYLIVACVVIRGSLR